MRRSRTIFAIFITLWLVSTSLKVMLKISSSLRAMVVFPHTPDLEATLVVVKPLKLVEGTTVAAATPMYSARDGIMLLYSSLPFSPFFDCNLKINQKLERFQ